MNHTFPFLRLGFAEVDLFAFMIADVGSKNQILNIVL